MSQKAHVAFVDHKDTSVVTRVIAPLGQTVLQAAHTANVEIPATCGARGRCQSCRVKILKGDAAPPTVQDTIQLGHEAVHERFRLSCQMELVGDCTILIAPPRAEVGHQILGAGSGLALPSGMPLNSGVQKYVVTAQIPADEEQQTSDVDEILAALGGEIFRDIPLDVLRKIPGVLREQKGKVTITTFNNAIINIEAGDTGEHKYGMAFDIGTTSVVGTLLDLDTGEQVARVANVNPQATYGGDLMSRIAFAQFDEKKFTTLRARILNAVNDFIHEACNQAGVSREHIYKIVIVGNTCMHHIFLGIDVSSIGFAPYAPVVRRPIVVPARDLPLKAAPNARVCFLPIVAGFVGADAVGAVLATRLYESEKIRVVVDIGTNSEIVMGSRAKLMACSAPAGPALEGGQISHGMRAAVGAIEGVEIDDSVRCKVIGDAPAIGICGSGLIDAMAKMLDANILDPSGLMLRDHREVLPPALRERLIYAKESKFILVPPEQIGTKEGVAITQTDIRQLQLAKGAIYSGILMLQRIMEISDTQIEELMLCGAFGNYININSAVRIRLLPQLPIERISYVGNAAHMGAEMALLSETERNRAYDIARSIEHVALAGRPEFQEVFVDAIGFAPPCQAPS
jgi:uncharacterized 2Fe-2S/4Fe-4S cluster protein (DUF4445 family)